MHTGKHSYGRHSNNTLRYPIAFKQIGTAGGVKASPPPPPPPPPLPRIQSQPVRGIRNLLAAGGATQGNRLAVYMRTAAAAAAAAVPVAAAVAVEDLVEVTKKERQKAQLCSNELRLVRTGRKEKKIIVTTQANETTDDERVR